MNSHRMFELAQALAVAKSRQDVPAALQLLHVDMLLESPAFGTMARGIAENEKVLTRFFTSFPDYNVVLQGHASNHDTWRDPQRPARRAAGFHPVRLQGRSDCRRAVLLRSVGALRPIRRLNRRGPAKNLWRRRSCASRRRIGTAGRYRAERRIGLTFPLSKAMTHGSGPTRKGR